MGKFVEKNKDKIIYVFEIILLLSIDFKMNGIVIVFWDGGRVIKFIFNVEVWI